jgi:hypothetical protein
VNLTPHKKLGGLFVLCSAVAFAAYLLFDTPGALGRAYSVEELQSKSLDSLLAIRQNMIDAQGETVACGGPLPPLQSTVGISDHFVQATVESVEIDVPFLIECIVRGKIRALYGDITYNIERAYPPLPQNTLTMSGAFVRESLREGQTVLVPIQRIRDQYFTQLGGLTGYPMNGDKVLGIAPGHREVSLEEAWALIEAAYSELGAAPPASEVAAKLALLRDGTVVEAAEALQYLADLAPDALTAAVLVESLESQHARLLNEVTRVPDKYVSAYNVLGERYRFFQNFAGAALDVLLPVATEAGAQRMFTFYKRDMSSYYGRFFEESELQRRAFEVIVSGDPAQAVVRARQLLGTRIAPLMKDGSENGSVLLASAGYDELRSLAKVPGQQAASLLEEIRREPERFHCPDYMQTEEAWTEIVTLRESVLSETEAADPEETLQQYIRRYLDGETSLARSIGFRADAPSEQLVEMLKRDKYFGPYWAEFIAVKVPTPGLVERLRAVIEEQGVFPYALDALEACGQPAQAWEFAIEILERPIPSEDLEQLEKDVVGRGAAMKYLGRTGNANAAPYIREQISAAALEGVAEAHREAYDRAFAAESEERRRYLGYRSPRQNPLETGLERDGLLALTKLRDESMVPRLEEAFESGHITERITAAVCLEFFGDATGEELLDRFTHHEERTIRAFDIHQSTEGATNEFLNAVLYLRGPVLDERVLIRLEKNLGFGDHDYFGDIDFVADYEGKLLDYLLTHLESDDNAAASTANLALQGFFGVDIGWYQSAATGIDHHKVAQWKAIVDGYAEATD